MYDISNYINSPFALTVKRVFYSVIHIKSSFLKSMRLAQFTVTRVWCHILWITSLWSFKYKELILLQILKNLFLTELSGVSLHLCGERRKVTGVSDSRDLKDGMQWLSINVTGLLPNFLISLSILTCEYPEVVIRKITNGHDAYLEASSWLFALPFTSISLSHSWYNIRTISQSRTTMQWNQNMD